MLVPSKALSTEVQVNALSTETAAFPALPTATNLPAPSPVTEFMFDVSNVELDTSCQPAAINGASRVENTAWEAISILALQVSAQEPGVGSELNQ